MGNLVTGQYNQGTNQNNANSYVKDVAASMCRQDNNQRLCAFSQVQQATDNMANCYYFRYTLAAVNAHAVYSLAHFAVPQAFIHAPEVSLSLRCLLAILLLHQSRPYMFRKYSSDAARGGPDMTTGSRVTRSSSLTLKLCFSMGHASRARTLDSTHCGLSLLPDDATGNTSRKT